MLDHADLLAILSFLICSAAWLKPEGPRPVFVIAASTCARRVVTTPASGLADGPAFDRATLEAGPQER